MSRVLKLLVVVLLVLAAPASASAATRPSAGQPSAAPASAAPASAAPPSAAPPSAAPPLTAPPSTALLRAHARLVPDELRGHAHAEVCPAPAPGRFGCDALRDTVATNVRDATGLPAGYAPQDLQSAYALPSGFRGAGQTVAVVDAFDDPTAAQDLATYRATYGLPPCGPSCFTKLNQAGVAGGYPAPDADWAGEISLDLDMVSAACPRCSIVLVEANSSYPADLFAAENTAATRGPVAISNSFSGGEFANEGAWDTTYLDHPGIAITASAGDRGSGAQYPAASPYVTAVGGTSLYTDPGQRGWQESAWSGSGGGCSAYEPKPAWQHDALCATRTENDVAAVADPNTGVAVFDSTPDRYGNTGWGVFGGTSASAPLVAATYALAAAPGGPGPAAVPAQYAYQGAGGLTDVWSGSNGSCGSGLCNATNGYDGPTGLGTPDGITAFAAPLTQDGGYQAVAPRRILDTRPGGIGPQGPVPANSVLPIQGAGLAGIPVGASAVVLNLTATQPTAAGWLAATPHTSPSVVPGSSTLNYVAGQTVANSVIVPVDAGGWIDIYNYEHDDGTAQVVVDVSGYFLPSSPGDPAALHPQPPTRALDTRVGVGAPAQPVVPGVPLRLRVTGQNGLPATGVASVVMNLTVTQPTGPGFVSAYPDGSAPPNASNVNFAGDQTVANSAVVPVGADGYVDLLTTSPSGATVQLVADISGWFSGGAATTPGSFNSVLPARILDTRNGVGAPGGPVSAGQFLRVRMTGQAGVPASGVAAVVLNLTVAQPTSAGFVTAFPDGGATPNTSNVNYVSGQTVPNLAIVPVSPDGYLDLYNYEHDDGTVQLIADISGWFAG